MSKLFSLVLICVFALPFPLKADEDLSHFNKALQRAISSSYQGWSFTATTREDDTTLVEFIDFSKKNGDRWTLVSINGKKASAAEIRKHSTMRQKESLEEIDAGEAPAHLANDFLRTIVKPGSVKFMGKENDNNLYSFRVYLGEGEEDFEQSLYGQISIKPNDTVITELRFFNKKAFSTMGVKISKLEHIMNFTVIESDNSKEKPVFLVSSKSQTQGVAMGFFNVDQKSSVLFQDYQKK